MPSQFEDENVLDSGSRVTFDNDQAVRAPTPYQGAPTNQFQGMNLMANQPKRVPGSPLLTWVIAHGLAKDEEGANKVLLGIAIAIFLLAAGLGFFLLRPPSDPGVELPYFEDVTPGQLLLIPEAEREAYLQSLPTRD